jgi:alkylation response protein AidB-like acyl-CoA dehydrogenase
VEGLGGSTVNFDLGDEIDELRDDVRDFADQHLTSAVIERMHQSGTPHDKAFALAMGQRGWIAPGWAPEEGGGRRSWVEQLVIREELDRVGAPVSGMSVTMLVANTIRLWGSQELKDRILGPAARGEIVIVLGYSEADCGSDVAAARTRADRVDQDWVINGEKMFTTHAHVADYVFLLTRTDTDAPKRRNLTMFLVPLNTPGIGVTEVKTLGGERTNITTYSEVHVPDAMRVGEVNGAWEVLGSALMFERASTWAPALDRLAREAMNALSSTKVGPFQREPSDEKRRIARVLIEAEVSRLLALKAGWIASKGKPNTAEGPMAKLFSTEAYTRASSDLLDLLGNAGLWPGTAPPEYGAPLVEHAFRHSQVTTIYGGTSEIQRSIIAERGLGLPRSRA